MSRLRRHWPLFAALSALYLTVAFFVAASLRQTQGHFIYALDDAYIHMAIAKNLALHGVWGVSREGFSSCASSLLWPLLLAGADRLAGVRELTPFVLNLLCSTLLVAWAYRALRRNGHPRLAALIGLLALIFIAPLPALIFVGMEHILHALLTVVFVELAAAALARDEDLPLRKAWSLLLTAPLLVMARYEGMFLVAVVCLFCLLRRRWRLGALLAGLGALPVVAFGLISLAKGWYFFPNSVLIKSSVLEASTAPGQWLTYGTAFINRMVNNQSMVIPAVLLLAVFVLEITRRPNLWRPEPLQCLFVALIFIPQLAFVDSGLFFRYETYLIAASLLAFLAPLPSLARSVRELGSWPKLRQALRATPRPVWMLGALLLLTSPLLLTHGYPLVARAYWTLDILAPACRNIYQQQYQMGLFVKKYYAGEGVALNDIGAVNYQAEIRCLDLMGLASMETAHAKRDGQSLSLALAQAAKAKGVKLAMCYDNWVGDALSPEWVRVGEWTIPDNRICGGATVAIYAADPAEKERLAACLKAFRAELPAAVR